MITATTFSYVFQSIVFFSFFSVGLTIECFQCNSVEHPGCSDLKTNDTNSQYYKKCDDEYYGQQPFCRKVVTEVVHVDDSARIYRSCGWIRKGNDTTKDDCRKGDTDFIKKRQCECFSNGCNAADRMMPSFTSIIMVAIGFNAFRESSSLFNL